MPVPIGAGIEWRGHDEIDQRTNVSMGDVADQVFAIYMNRVRVVPLKPIQYDMLDNRLGGPKRCKIHTVPLTVQEKNDILKSCHVSDRPHFVSEVVEVT
ncbi:hypothetical protein, partial [Mesorhizobium sp.]|uniref:hypothetical protein n=1 Tax=Mesorhizobium sp. TaxID=1871066 RepID=UPI002627F1AA